MPNKRDFDDPLYIKWRKSVYVRDKFQCQYPNCGSHKLLNAHHIKKWAVHESLRFVVSNGITLCKKHHDMVWGREEEYEALFLDIVNRKSGISVFDIQRLIRIANGDITECDRVDKRTKLYKKLIEENERRKGLPSGEV